MNQFLTRSAMFSIPILIGIFLLNEVMLRSPNDLSRKYELLQEEKGEAIFLGSSHTYFGVNPEKMEKCSGINLAYASQSIDYDNFIIVNNKEQLKKFKFLYIELSYHSFPYLSYKEKGGIETTLYRHFWQFDKDYSEGFLKKQFVFFSYGFKNSINHTAKKVLGINEVRANKYGWAARKPSKESLEKTAIIDANRHNKLWEKKFTEENIEIIIKYTEELIKTAKEQSVKPVLFNTPLNKEYLKRTETIHYQRYLSICESLANKHQIEFLNFASDTIQFKDIDFADSDHLTPKGATKFSKLLENKIYSDN